MLWKRVLALSVPHALDDTDHRLGCGVYSVYRIARDREDFDITTLKAFDRCRKIFRIVHVHYGQGDPPIIGHTRTAV